MKEYQLVPGDTAGSFESMLRSTMAACNVTAHTIKGSLKDHNILSVRTDEWTQNYVDKQRKAVLSEKTSIEKICKSTI